MKRLITLLIAAVLLGVFMGCQPETDLNLSAEKELEIKQAYLDAYDEDHSLSVDDLVLRIKWRSGKKYALYIDGGGGQYFEGTTVIRLEGMPFWFPSSQALLIYDGERICPLKQAYDAGMLTTEDLEGLQKDYAYINLPPESGFWDPTMDREAWVNNG